MARRNKRLKRETESGTKTSVKPGQGSKSTLNPFDLRVTKRKHEISGNKVKGVQGRPGLKRQLGDEVRKSTLLEEYGQRRRGGGIVDRRFGQGDLTISPEAKMLERFTRAQQARQEAGEGGRSGKRRQFNIEEEDGDEAGDTLGQLTHLGTDLERMDPTTLAGPRPRNLSNEEEGDEFMDPQAHFGGGALGRPKADDNLFQVHPSRRAIAEEVEEDAQDEGRKKSKAEVMSELIAKSKGYKYERQKIREENEDERLELDKEFDELKDILFEDQTANVTEDSLPSIPNGSAQVHAPTRTADDDYDETYRQLNLDRRARPTDRLKTEEELAREEAEALEAAEKERLARMSGENIVKSAKGGLARRRRDRIAQADDLQDDFTHEDDTNPFGAGVGQISQEAENSSSDEEPADLGPGGAESANEEIADLDESESESSIDEQVTSPRSAAEVKGPDSSNPASSEDATKPSRQHPTLPFTFSCPASHPAFLSLLTSVCPTGQEIVDMEATTLDTVIHRVRILHHPSRDSENPSRLRSFLDVLLDHFIWLCQQSEQASRQSVTPVRMPLQQLDIITQHVYALTSAYSSRSAQLFANKISLMNRNLNQGLLNDKAGKRKARTWPGLTELCFLTLVGKIWPTSDLNHPVVLLASLLLGRFLEECRVRRLQDLVAGLFTCSIFHDYQLLSKRIVPEVVNFLGMTLASLSPAVTAHERLSPPQIWTFPVLPHDLDFAVTPSTKDAQPLALTNLLRIEDEARCPERILLLCLQLISDFSALYSSCQAFPELMGTVESLLQGIEDLKDANKFAPNLQTIVRKTLLSLQRTSKLQRTSRQSLTLHQHRPIPLATHIPKFDTTFRPLAHASQADPDATRAGLAKLKALVKREKKGAMRSLRGDNAFLSREKARVIQERDQEYKSKIKRIMGGREGLEQEQAEAKRDARSTRNAKAKAKRLAGK